MIYALASESTQPLVLSRHEDFYSVRGNPFFSFCYLYGRSAQTPFRRSVASWTERANYEDMDLWLKLGDARGYVLPGGSNLWDQASER